MDYPLLAIPHNKGQNQPWQAGLQCFDLFSGQNVIALKPVVPDQKINLVGGHKPVTIPYNGKGNNRFPGVLLPAADKVDENGSHHILANELVYQDIASCGAQAALFFRFSNEQMPLSLKDDVYFCLSYL